ncbi:hypothetical protein LCM23_14725 [Cytobacillus kochii]|uniref:hypothetical protein n=1 Tax=Cytobacillus kochii TaxID=859143 RepID=UPI001CD1EB78|nr:hypothetical protein [Cytobacillus kochii]MCA1027350.1 hypothetical protein [Cytobacillus kochii]
MYSVNLLLIDKSGDEVVKDLQNFKTRIEAEEKAKEIANAYLDDFSDLIEVRWTVFEFVSGGIIDRD